MEELYSESYENIDSVSNRVIFLLLDNMNIGSLKVLQALIS